MVRAEKLTKVFHLPRGKTIEAVRDFSFSVARGEILGILGPNGAGKTTLLRMLATILTPTSGRCFINAIPTDDEPEAARRQMGFLSGNTKLYGRLTPRELLRYFGCLYSMTEFEIETRTATLAAMLDMEDVLDRRCETLSTGQLQKVSIGRVMLHNPPVLILDEPTLGLDIVSSGAILDFIAEAKTRGRAVVYSTHYMTEAELLCDRIALIHKGVLLAEGTKEALFALAGTNTLKEAFLYLVGKTGKVGAEIA